MMKKMPNANPSPKAMVPQCQSKVDDKLCILDEVEEYDSKRCPGQCKDIEIVRKIRQTQEHEINRRMNAFK